MVSTEKFTMLVFPLCHSFPTIFNPFTCIEWCYSVRSPFENSVENLTSPSLAAVSTNNLPIGARLACIAFGRHFGNSVSMNM